MLYNCRHFGEDDIEHLSPNPPPIECMEGEADDPKVPGLSSVLIGLPGLLVVLIVFLPAIVLPFNIWNSAIGDPKQKNSSHSKSKG